MWGDRRGNADDPNYEIKALTAEALTISIVICFHTNKGLGADARSLRPFTAPVTGEDGTGEGLQEQLERQSIATALHGILEVLCLSYGPVDSVDIDGKVGYLRQEVWKIRHPDRYIVI